MSPATSPDELLQSIRRVLRFLVGSTIGLALVLVIIAVYVLVINARTHDALCTFRSNLVSQVNQTDDFLKSHPQGLPKLGLTAATLQAQELRLRASADSLGQLGCSGPDLGGSEQ